jgi:hypothetical protein
MLPLLGASTQAASLLLDRNAPKRYEGAELFSGSSASRDLLPFVLALGAIALACSLWSFATTAPARRRLPLWAFACLPAVAFAVQEHVEYAVAHGRVPWTLATSRVFLAGLLLQVPFGALAYLAARLLVGIAGAIAGRSAGRGPALRRRSDVRARPRADAPRRLCSSGDRRLTRGPPVLVPS